MTQFFCSTPYARDATQATVEVTTTAQCSEIAIVAGETPEVAESRASANFFAAQHKCAPSRTVAALVLAPDGGARASVIVIAALTRGVLAQCQPPFYSGCIA